MPGVILRKIYNTINSITGNFFVKICNSNVEKPKTTVLLESLTSKISLSFDTSVGIGVVDGKC